MIPTSYKFWEYVPVVAWSGPYCYVCRVDLINDLAIGNPPTTSLLSWVDHYVLNSFGAQSAFPTFSFSMHSDGNCDKLIELNCKNIRHQIACDNGGGETGLKDGPRWTCLPRWFLANKFAGCHTKRLETGARLVLYVSLKCLCQTTTDMQPTMWHTLRRYVLAGHIKVKIQMRL